MKTKLLILTLLISALSFAQYTAIPDANFENALSAYDDIPNDGQVPTANINTVTILNIPNQNISDLTGIEAFSNLQNLEATGNNLTAVDISQNVNLGQVSFNSNQLTSIDLSSNSNLHSFSCFNNQLTEIDLSLNTNLTQLYCVANSPLTNIKMNNGNNTNVTTMYATNCPNLTCILVDDVAYSNANWTNIDPQTSFSLNCHYDETYVPDNNFENYLETHNASGNTVSVGDPNSMGNGVANDDYVTTASINTVTILYVHSLSIADMTGIEDFTALNQLYCFDNQLTALNVSNNTALTILSCYYNQLTALDVSNNTVLNQLVCSSNQLTALDVSNNTALTNLGCTDNQLTELDVSNNTVLNQLYCSSNQLTVLDVSNNPILTVLWCLNNQLTALDTSSNTVLNQLLCFNNQLTTLDVSNNALLNKLVCSYNQLTALDVSSNTALTYFSCSNNQLTSLNVKNGNNTNFSQFDALNNLNLTCIEVDDVTWSTNNWTQIDTTSSFSLNCHYNETYVPDNNFENYLETHNASGTTVAVGDPTSMGNGIANDDYVTTTSINTVTNLDVNSLNIADLTGVEDFAALQNLDCRINSLTTLNVTQNNNLLVLIAHDNQLNSLDLSGNTQLTGLGVFNNGLTSIDLSNNPLLTSLGLADNALTTLDLTNNTSVQFFQCENNQITNLDVSMIPTLKTLYCFNNQLTSLNVKSGNNTNITSSQFRSYGNPNLTCIIVDDAAYSTTNWTNIDPASTFVNSQAACDALAITNEDYFNNLTIYPNPTKNHVTIKTDRISNYKIFNITGQIIKKGKITNGENNLNVNNLNQGIYFIKITDNHTEITKKLIIK